MIHFDTHTYYYNCYNNKYDHSSFMFYDFCEELIDPIHVVQIDIFTEYPTNFECTILDVEYMNKVDIQIIVDKIMSVVRNLPAYLTFDIDCLDPSLAPGTGTPVIEG